MNIKLAITSICLIITIIGCNIIQNFTHPRHYNCDNQVNLSVACSDTLDVCYTPSGIKYECGSLVFHFKDTLGMTLVDGSIIQSAFDSIEYAWSRDTSLTNHLPKGMPPSINIFDQGMYKRCACRHNIYLYHNDLLNPAIIEDAAAHASNHGPIIDSGVDLNTIFNIEGNVPLTVQDWIRVNDPCEITSSISPNPELLSFPSTEAIDFNPIVVDGESLKLKFSPDEKCCECPFEQHGSNNGKVTIAILDTGLDAYLMPEKSVYNQPGIHSCLPNDNHGWNFVDSTNNINDNHGHGTMVALSYLYGLKTLNYPISEQRILPVKVMNECGAGTLFDITCGIYYARDKDVDLINMSLGAYLDSSRILENAIRLATLDTILVVCSAGNNGYKMPLTETRDHYPSCLNKLVSNKLELVYEIGGTCKNPKLLGCNDHDLALWPKSNYRPGMFLESSIHYQLILEDFVQLPLPGKESLDGTSFSTPLYSSGLITELKKNNYPSSSVLVSRSTTILQGNYKSYFINNSSCQN